jgi:hypothetical protein
VPADRTRTQDLGQADMTITLAPRSSCLRLYLNQRKGASRPVAVAHGAPRAYGAAPEGTERLSPRHLPVDAAMHHHLVVNLIIR